MDPARNPRPPTDNHFGLGAPPCGVEQAGCRVEEDGSQSTVWLSAEVVFFGAANSPACEVSSQLDNTRKRVRRVISRESLTPNLPVHLI